jgi:hypothetical protein
VELVLDDTPVAFWGISGAADEFVEGQVILPLNGVDSRGPDVIDVEGIKLDEPTGVDSPIGELAGPVDNGMPVAVGVTELVLFDVGKGGIAGGVSVDAVLLTVGDPLIFAVVEPVSTALTLGSPGVLAQPDDWLPVLVMLSRGPDDVSFTSEDGIADAVEFQFDTGCEAV